MNSNTLVKMSYNGIVLKNRRLNQHEIKCLLRVNKQSEHAYDNTVIIPNDNAVPVTRHLYIEPRAHYHLNAVLAMWSCYVDDTCESLIKYKKVHCID